MPSKPINNKTIAVLGAGSWGTALASVLARNGSKVIMWGNDAEELENIATKHCNSHYLPDIQLPDNIDATPDLAEAIAAVDEVLIVVPSHAFREVVLKLKALRGDLRIAWGTKGLDPETHLLLSQVVATEYGADTPMAVISGPSFATEVARELPTAVAIAGNDDAFVDHMLERMHGPHFRMYRNADMNGVQACGVVKNILAIATGITDGMNFGANTRAALMTRGLAEMARLVKALGGEANTVNGLAGLGDLILTCTDDQSRNRRFGLAVGKGMSVDAALEEIMQVVEGYLNAKQVFELAEQHGLDMPIVMQVYRVLYQGVAPKVALQELLERPAHKE